LGLPFTVAPMRTTGIGYAVVRGLKPIFAIVNEETERVINSSRARVFVC
jgi:hypothetical protein